MFDLGGPSSVSEWRKTSAVAAIAREMPAEILAFRQRRRIR
jgi:hypothetical protein